MIRLQPRTRQLNTTPSLLSLVLAACVSIALAAASVSAQLGDNQTHGYGANELVTLTYLQNLTVSINRT